MYTPAQFKVEDVGEAHALMRAYPFAILVTHGAGGIVATHLPTVLKADGTDPLGCIECHLARPNPQWKTFAPDAEALMIFQGPQAYVRPGWYPSKAEHGKAVPTWNYAVVHAYGRLEAVEDQAWLLAHVGELSDQQEAAYDDVRWSMADAPADYLERQARGIVGLRLRMTRLEGKVKMSQNREARDRDGVVRGLARRGEGHDAEAAALVERFRR
ncbi:MAG: FMN-binding negative transcriptional regulator [Hyphomicrobiaceae bacterium]|nr:MAG: FMN-binding negative transcriptional regulator [Hyphomicrobiaceae bacterium]